jgi:cyclopropane-fatty-acyl-phospholipid synthase
VLAERNIHFAPEINSTKKSVGIHLDFLDHLFEFYPRRDFRVRLWDGTVWGRGNPGRFALLLKHPGALRKMFLSPSELTLGESYIFNDFDIEVDIEASFAVADFLLSEERSSKKKLHLASLLVTAKLTSLHIFGHAAPVQPSTLIAHC